MASRNGGKTEMGEKPGVMAHVAHALRDFDEASQRLTDLIEQFSAELGVLRPERDTDEPAHGGATAARLSWV